MKNFFLKTGLTLLCLIIELGSAWGETYSFTPDKATTGNSATAYVTSAYSFTCNNIGWSFNQWNPSTLQIKTNQSSAGSEFNFKNTSAFPGKITSVVITFKALTVSDASKLCFIGGSSAISSLSGGTSGTWNSTAKTLTWTPASTANYTYFAFYQNGKAASGTNYLAEANAIVVTYENSTTKTLSSIAVKTAPTKTNYTEGENFDPAGLVLTGTYSDTSTEDIAYADHASDFTFSPALTTALTTSNTSVTITYGSKTTTQSITVNEAPKHTAYFYSNGSLYRSEQYAEGADITLPTGLSAINGKNFVGWVTSTIDGTTDTTPDFVESATMGDHDVTYYAVYATQTGSGSSEPTLVNSTSGLVAGNTYYIAASATYASTATAMGASTGGNNFPATSFQYAVPLTLGGNATDGWTFSYTDGGTTYYLDPTSTTGSNYLKRNESVTNYGKFSISFSSNAAVITSLGKSSRNNLRYNSSSTCFSCYSSGQGDVYLFAEGGGTTYSDYCTTVGDEPTPTKTLTGIEVTGTPAEFWKGDDFNHNGMTVTANYDDSSSEDVTNSATFSTPDMSTAGEKTVTVTYQDQTDTYNITVKTIANTQATAYTVAKAKELIDAGKDLGTEVYVAGKVSQVDSYSSTYKSITYWISTDGTTSGQFEIYGGKGLENADFSSMDDVQVGAEVIVYGKLKKFNSTYELDSNNYLVSYSYTPPTTDFIKTPTATVKVLDPISIKDYINGEYSSYDITTSIDGKTQKDYEFVCIYDQIRFCKAGTYVVDVTGTSGSDTQNGQVTFTVTPTGAELSSVTIGGTLTKTTYTVGESFDRTGLTLTANCSDGSHANVTDEAEWEADPATFTEAGTTTVVVMGTYCGESDIQEYTVTVNAAPQAVTWDLTTDNTATATANEISWTSAAVSMSDTKGTSGTTDANSYYGGDSQGRTSTRFYKNSTLAFTPENGITITSIIYNATTEGYATALANSTWTNATASADGTTVTITPTNGAQVVSAIIGGTTGASGVTVYYSGSATPATEYNINLNQNAGGTISASVEKATAGTEITLTATPNTGYVFSEWTVLDGNANEVEVINNKFVMPESDVEVEATFEEKGAQETLYLDFDFINHPANWPVNKANAAAGTYTYTLDGKDYDFTMTKSGDGIYLSGVSGTSGYLLMASGNQLGLPALEGYKLTQVVGQLNSSGTPSTSSIASVTDGTNEVSGGEGQTWGTKGEKYTYNLTGTEVNTVYYLAISNKNCQMINLKLTYEKASAKVLDHISLDGQTTTFTEGDEFAFGGTVMAHYDDESTKDVTTSATFTGYDMSILGTEQTVTVSYTEGGVTKEASYNIIVNAATKYTVTIIEPENGTLVVKHGEETIASGTSVVSGTVLTIEATPADGYDYQNWQYKVEGGSWVTKYTNYDYTVDSNVSFRANFEPIVTGTFTINYSVNGIIRKTETLDANASLNFPAVSSMYGKVFLGWTTSEVPDEVDVQPETVGAIKATTDATYYALFATKNTTAGSDELTKVDELVAGMDVILAMEEAGTPSKGISGVDNEHSTAIVSTDPSEWVKFTVNVIGENTCLAYGTQYVTPSDKKENKFKLTDDNGTNFYIDNHQLGYTTDDDYILAENHSTSAGKDEYFYRFYKTSTVSGNTNPNQVYTPFFVYTDGSSTTYSAYTTLPSYVKLDESTTNGTYENETFGTVKIIRSMKADDTWNSLCLPFSMNEEQITTAFGEDTDVRELTTASVTGTAPDEVLHLNFTQVTAIEAGKLYMVRVPAAITEFYVEDTEVNTAEPVQDYSKGDYTIQAHSNYNYMDGTTNGYVPVGSFVISSNKFMQVGSSTQKMKAFRGYITATDASGNPVKALGIGFIDPLTGINNVEFNTDARIYNLQGLQQSKVQKGINIVNGKKIIR